MSTTAVAPTGPRGSASAGVARSSRPARHRLRLFVVLGVVAAAVVFLLAEGLGSSLNYFDTVNQAMAQRATLGTRTFRLEGTVVNGTIHGTGAGTDFVVTAGGQRVAVQNIGEPPDLFQASIPVVVVGHFTSSSSDTFISNQILVKHSSDYIAQHPARVKAPNGSVR